MRKALLFALSLVGLFVSLYLWWAYTSPSRPLVCVGTGCDVVRASAYANFAGLPLPLYGTAMYAALALLIFTAPLLAPNLARAARFAVAGISGAGFFVSAYLSGIEEFVLHAWCAWCVVSALAITAIFIVAVVGLLRPEPAALTLAVTRSQLVVFAAAFAIGAPSFFYLSRHGDLSPAQLAAEQIVNERLLRADSHAYGSPQAPVTVVEFGDFQCPYCAGAEESAREVRKKYGTQVRFVFRQFPVVTLHAYAEKAAEASECAAEQGKFWEAVEMFYKNQNDLGEPALKRYAAEVGLDPARFDQCLASGKMAARVQRDIDDARAIGVVRTPTYIVNRRMFEGALDLAQFSELIDQALASRGTTPGQPAGLRAGADAATSPGLLANPSAQIFSQLQNSATACSEDEARKRQPVLIRTPEARDLFSGPSKGLFVDVRTARGFASHIPGAINLPVDEFERRWNTLPKDRTLVLYESGRSPGDICGASRAAGRVLIEHGFSPERVKVYQDGLAGWEKARLPVEPARSSVH